MQCTVYFPLNVILQTWLHTSCRLISSLPYFSREASPTNSTQFWGSCGLTILDLELLLSAWGCFGVEGIRYLDATELEPGTSREKLRERCTEIQYLITMSGLIDKVWIPTPLYVVGFVLQCNKALFQHAAVKCWEFWAWRRGYSGLVSSPRKFKTSLHFFNIVHYNYWQTRKFQTVDKLMLDATKI